MAAICPDVGEKVLLEKILEDNYVLKIYKNDYTPSESTVLGDLQECDVAGYAPVTLVAGTWDVQQSGGQTFGVYKDIKFTFTAGSRNYGYYITNAVNQLIFVESFGGEPISNPVGGGELILDITVSLQ